jgi:hypothetical protein
MMYPLVRELTDADAPIRVPEKVTCQRLGFSNHPDENTQIASFSTASPRYPNPGRAEARDSDLGPLAVRPAARQVDRAGVP